MLAVLIEMLVRHRIVPTVDFAPMPPIHHRGHLGENVMTRHAYRCAGCDDLGGPTACVAHPSVLSNIRKQVRESRVLSAADARLAQSMGLLGIPSIGRSGWNDGTIYPTDDDGPTDTVAMRSARPTERVSLGRATGTLNCLVLLVDFSDNQGSTASAHFQRLLFDRSNPGSMASYYHDLSGGALAITGSVVGWLRAPQPYSFYTNGDSGTGRAFPKNTPGLLHDMLTQYCASNSLAPFDANGDGFVDGLFIVHAGAGAETERDPAKRKNMIWSHKWTLPTPFVNNGIKAFAYFTAPEDGRLGVFAHEFGHFIGLPDLYDTSYRSAGIGSWCLMAGGSWNGGGHEPARLSAWCLAELGWIKPRNVSKAGLFTLDTLERNATDCLRVWSGGGAGPEYFLLENRQPAGRDAKLPGQGLAVWHIDERQSDNTNPFAFRVALVQADGRRDLELNANSGDDADLFPGSGGVSKVNDKGAAPSTRSNSGSPTGVALTRIRDSGGIVKLHVKV